MYVRIQQKFRQLDNSKILHTICHYEDTETGHQSKKKLHLENFRLQKMMLFGHFHAVISPLKQTILKLRHKVAIFAVKLGKLP